MMEEGRRWVGGGWMLVVKKLLVGLMTVVRLGAVMVVTGVKVVGGVMVVAPDGYTKDKKGHEACGEGDMGSDSFVEVGAKGLEGAGLAVVAVADGEEEWTRWTSEVRPVQ